jgi:LacI family transcriptional regulator
VKKRPTQKDVAMYAGVSTATVSQVINHRSGGNVRISDDTRQRVWDAVEELGYLPNVNARSLRTQKTYTIASIIPDITNPFYPAFQRGIQGVTQRHGYDLLTYDTDGSPVNERRSLRLLEQGRVDGAIVVLFHLDHEALRPILERNMPLVALVAGAHEVGNLPIDTIYIDNTKAAKTAVSYLISRGHTRIGMIAGVEATPPRRSRIRGYQQALAEHHLPLDEILIQGGDFTEKGGYQTMQDLLDLSPRPTAVFAANDLMAIGAMIAIREAGLAVPHDMAVVGFDDIPAASWVNPALTTISHFQQRLGERAAEMLFERLHDDALEPGRSVEMPFELTIRDSG